MSKMFRLILLAAIVLAVVNKTSSAILYDPFGQLSIFQKYTGIINKKVKVKLLFKTEIFLRLFT